MSKATLFCFVFFFAVGLRLENLHNIGAHLCYWKLVFLDTDESLEHISTVGNLCF